MVFAPSNATGWSYLIDGNVLSASFFMFDTALQGWLFATLFFVYNIVLYLKTQNLTTTFTMNIFFLSIYLGLTRLSILYPIINPFAVRAIFLLLVIQFAAILYSAFWR